MGKMRRALICLPLLALASACVRLQVEPIRIEPIYIEMTINHRIQRDLDSFFADLDRASASLDYEPLEEWIEE